jgi:hypothetical protein
MKSLFDIFSTPPKMHIGDIQRKKGYYAGLHAYYQEKIVFLSKKGIDRHLLKLASQDAPGELRAKMDNLRPELYRKKCLEYYQSKLKTVKDELKKIDRIKLKHE